MVLAEVPVYYAGGGFPWGLLIIGLIVYFLWRNGVFDGRGRFGNGPRYGGGYGEGYHPAQSPETLGFRGPREVFEEWHRQAHEAAGTQSHGPTAPQAPGPAAEPRTETPPSGNSEPAR